MGFCKKCGKELKNKSRKCEYCSTTKTNIKKHQKIINILRYIFGSLLLITALNYRDWRILLFLISGILFYPFIYNLISKKIQIKYWVQIIIAIIFLIVATIAENIYIKANGLVEYSCEEGETLVGTECLSCPEGYEVNIEEKNCTITDKGLKQEIEDALIGTSIKDVELIKDENGMYDLNLTYYKSEVHLHIAGADAVYFAKEIMDIGDINSLITKIHIIVKDRDNIKYIIDINNFNKLSKSELEENLVLMDSNEIKINKTLEQVKNDYILEYKNNCNTYDYKTIFRYAEEYKGKDIKYTGEVVQVIGENSFRVNVTKDKWGFYEDTVFVRFIDIDDNTPRILEDDIITFYGTVGDLYTYETVMGASVTIPSVNALYIDLN